MAAAKKTPLRKCMGCGEQKDKKKLIRVIKTPEDQIEIDFTGRKNGRGAYICNSKKCFMRARKSKGLERSLKCAIPSEIYDRLEGEIDNE